MVHSLNKVWKPPFSMGLSINTHRLIYENETTVFVILFQRLSELFHTTHARPWVCLMADKVGMVPGLMEFVLLVSSVLFVLVFREVHLPVHV